MNYAQALAYLQSLTDVERIAPASDAPRFDLGRVVELLGRLGHPERQFRSIHVVGTKGKGSTAAMIAAILRAADYRVGLYTSPHLHTFRERLRIDGGLITPGELAEAVRAVEPIVAAVHEWRPGLGRLTTFEVTTAIALDWFARRGVDFAVLEAGLGGRLDATNVVQPLVAALTPVALDHTEYLGHTVAAVAAEKAAVIKPNVAVVSAAQQAEAAEVVRAAAAASGASLAFVGSDWRWRTETNGVMIAVQGPDHAYGGIAVPLLGKHQLENATLAVAAVDALRANGFEIPSDAIRRGIAEVRWPGRLEVLADRPALVVDGAHNPTSMERLREALVELFPGRRLIVVLGSSVDKDLAGIAAAIAPAARAIVVTQSRHPRSAPLPLLLKTVAQQGIPTEAAADVCAALERARALAGPDGVVCASGSLFVVAEAREAVLGRQAVESDPSDVERD